ncbi:MAG: hypothetical protein Ct9H300mP19_16820 [Dehalococcoidia bacterium]|nr:MAG: hypothetical protein Ct9H300mP19_16820 [Dehalococcoidia bacterium]
MEKAAVKYLSDPARHDKPFAMCVGFIAPHFPFIVPNLLLKILSRQGIHAEFPDGHLDELPPSARRLRQMFGLDGDWTDDEIARARALISVFAHISTIRSDFLWTPSKNRASRKHRDCSHVRSWRMLGEHGLGERCPFTNNRQTYHSKFHGLEISKKGLRIGEAVSNVDAVATILDLAGVNSISGISMANH